MYKKKVFIINEVLLIKHCFLYYSVCVCACIHTLTVLRVPGVWCNGVEGCGRYGGRERQVLRVIGEESHGSASRSPHYAVISKRLRSHGGNLKREG